METSKNIEKVNLQYWRFKELQILELFIDNMVVLTNSESYNIQYKIRIK